MTALIGDYKGFRARKSPDVDATWINVFYVAYDSEERCVGQSQERNWHNTVELYLRKPLSTWMTKLDEAWSPHSDQKHIASTCVHDVSLSHSCDKCIEHYGSARYG